MHCGLLINCTYDGEGLVGHALGPLLTGDKEDGTGEPNGEVRVEKQILNHIKGICPELAELDFLITPLEKPIYITE